MSLFLLLHYTSVNYSTHTKFHPYKSSSKNCTKLFPFTPSIIRCSNHYTIPLQSLPGLQNLIRRQYSVYSWFLPCTLCISISHFFTLSTILPIPIIYYKLSTIPLFNLYNAIHPLFQSLHYTPFHYTSVYYTPIGVL